MVVFFRFTGFICTTVKPYSRVVQIFSDAFVTHKTCLRKTMNVIISQFDNNNDYEY